LNVRLTPATLKALAILFWTHDIVNRRHRGQSE
jgi:hypothetical protein